MDLKIKQLILKYVMLKHDLLEDEKFHAAKHVQTMIDDLKLLMKINDSKE